jgi:hypothetical protein
MRALLFVALMNRANFLEIGVELLAFQGKNG